MSYKKELQDLEQSLEDIKSEFRTYDSHYRSIKLSQKMTEIRKDISDLKHRHKTRERNERGYC